MKSDTGCTGSTTLGTQSLGAPSHPSPSNTTCLNIDDLPEFLLVEILCRLPCKFVLRCKCVCKSWSTLISEPYFNTHRALYLRHNNCDSNELVPTFVNEFVTSRYGKGTELYSKIELFTVDPKQFPPRVKVKPALDFCPNFDEVTATYNDLILLCDYDLPERKDIYYICNPYTKQWVALPPAPPAPPCDGLQHVREGFACDSDNRCCKVVRLFGYRQERRSLNYPEKIEVQIFSSDEETGKWTESYLVLQGGYKSCNSFDSIDGRDTPVAHNGTLYWITSCGNLITLELFSKLNMNSTTCHGRFISSPHSLKREYFGGVTLCVCQGFVRLCHFYSRPESRHNISVWELKEEEEWCFRELIDLQPLLPSLPKTSNRFMAFDPNDEDILYILRTECPPLISEILMCNIRKFTVTEISHKFKNCVVFKSVPFVLPLWRWPTPVPRLKS